MRLVRHILFLIPHLPFCLGRSLLSSDAHTFANDVLPSDRTIKNEVNRMARVEQERLKEDLVATVENRCLSISPDIWQDNHRKISYMGATVHYSDNNYRYYSIDLFCSEFNRGKKNGENIMKVKTKKRILSFTIL